MLELKNIKKDYPAGGDQVHALRDVSLQFRKSEFVSILGPSGCGKTTLLNLVGGLDSYTSGDLTINGKSTKDYNDRDWDTYRNHSVGFVFQSYNLIPHQSVLQNVELALTLSGEPKASRRKKALAALEKVGLLSQIKKKPSEMSGGQMQRVAIARAIVNNPDIILADEPTGALDTETSVQVMDILKEISRDRLVIMVTHNPELAEKYSTRIIRMLDGVITSDTAPLTEEEIKAEHTAEIERRERDKGIKKPSMSFFTSFGLSLKNLFTKKGRTVLTSLAGSIGIIGIALIYAVSQGMTTFINTVQEDTLSSYPLTIESQSMDLGSLMQAFIGAAEATEKHDKDAVYLKSMVYNLVNALNSTEMNENDLKSFMKYIEEERYREDSSFKEAISGIQYTYDSELLVYTKNIDGKIIKSDSQKLMQDILIEFFGMDLSTMINMGENSGSSAMMSMSPAGSSMKLWQELLPGDNGAPVNPLLEKQYDVVYGTWPNDYNEIVLVLDENNELDDITLYALGLKSKEDIDEVTRAAVNKTEIKVKTEKWSYEEICDMEFRVILNSNCYTYDAVNETYTDLRDSETGLKYLYDNGLTLKVSGIIRPNEDAVSTILTGSIGYTHDLTEYIIENSKDSAAVNAQLDTPTTDIFTGLPFRDNSETLSDEEKETEFRAYIENLSEAERGRTYVKIMSIPSAESVEAAVAQSIGAMTVDQMKETLVTSMSAQTGMGIDELEEYIFAMSDDEIIEIFTAMVVENFKMQYAAGVQMQMSSMSSEQLVGALAMALPTYTTEQCAVYYDEVLEFSDSTYKSNLKKLGYVSLDNPSTINLYASSFENKDVIEEVIAEYNKSVDELSEIKYTDYVGIMMSSVTTIINAITYVLIAFVAVSLIVSSIMIGVITLISVQERTKEIGILRAIGASKKNVSSLFNAETMIIGFTSGLLGVGITYLLCIPINMILHVLTGINNLSAYLPIHTAVILVAISVLLTLFAGIIPSRSAAKKDPVVALRTE